MTMRKPTKAIITLTLSAVMLSACSIFFEKDMKAISMNIIAPADKDSTSNSGVTFWWEDVKGASFYSLQVVRGSFDNVSQLILDSNVTTNKYTLTLNPGHYQWRIRAANQSSNSAYFTRDLVILSSDSLSAQTMVLRSPADNFSTKSSSISFSWYPISSVSYYTFELRTSAGGLVYSTNTSDDSISLSGLVEGDYIWKVRASNDHSSTLFSSRNLYIDTTSPNTPVLLTPSYADSISSGTSFTWDRGTVSGSAIADSFIIYSDSLNTISQIHVCTVPNYTIGTLSAGRYFWRVRSVDAAYNVSAYSSTGKFYFR
jgi:predicted secreted protein